MRTVIVSIALLGILFLSPIAGALSQVPIPIGDWQVTYAERPVDVTADYPMGIARYASEDIEMWTWKIRGNSLEWTSPPDDFGEFRGTFTVARSGNTQHIDMSFQKVGARGTYKGIYELTGNNPKTLKVRFPRDHTHDRPIDFSRERSRGCVTVNLVLALRN